MTINGAGWLDWTDHFPGPGNKVYAEPNAGLGIVWHSMEGWYDWSFNGELMNPNRQASWMFSIKLDGTLVEHYPITASCWASGNGLANTHWWSVELEGLFSMPINAAQLMTAEALIAEWAEWSGKVPSRAGQPLGGIFGDGLKTMLEHREVDTIVAENGGETACPSERYAPLWAALEGEIDMTRDELLQILQELGVVGPGIPTVKRLDEWATENSVAVSERLANIEGKHEALNATVTPMARDLQSLARGALPDHEHTPGRVKK
jgi:hypothetical protein